MGADAASRRTRWRRWVLGGSVAAHALLLAALPRVSPPAPQLAAPEVEIEVREVPVEPRAPVQPVAPAPASRDDGARTASSRPSTPAPARPVASPPPSPEPAAGEANGTLGMRAPDLSVGGALLDRLAREGVIAETPAPAAPAPRTPRWQERARVAAREQQGRANVRQGNVHPQYYDLLRDAEKVFTPPTAAIEADPRSPTTAGKSMRMWARGFWHNYHALLERQGKDERSEGRGERREDEPSGVLRNYNRLLRAAAAGDTAITCRVCLVFSPGKPPEVVVAAGSGNAAIDEMAVEAMKKAVARRELEKDLLPGRADPARVCYRFEAKMGRIPPIPVVGCGFDETTFDVACYYPLMKTFKTDVVLDAVEYRGGG